MSINLDKMSLMRAFTTKRNRSDMGETNKTGLGRAASYRAGRPVQRAQISGPVALISTSNSLYINADDVAEAAMGEKQASNLTTTSISGEESDASMLSLDTTNITEASSSDESSPATPELEPNHLSCYFKPAVDTSAHSSSPSMSRKTSFETVPAIPQRMPSHSKKAHERLHRKRSVQRVMSPVVGIRSSLDMFGGAARSPGPIESPAEGPFGSELAQLDMVAEEFASVVDDAHADVDITAMQKYGLATFAASDYMTEIQDLLLTFWTEDAQEPVWI